MVQRARLQHKNEAYTLFSVLFFFQLYISNFLLQLEQFTHIDPEHSPAVSSHPHPISQKTQIVFKGQFSRKLYFLVCDCARKYKHTHPSILTVSTDKRIQEGGKKPQVDQHSNQPQRLTNTWARNL